MIEAGVPEFESVLWFGLQAPAGTPQPIVDKLHRAVNEALKSDDVIKSLNAQTIAPLIGTQADYVKHLDNERKRWTPIIESAGLRK